MLLDLVMHLDRNRYQPVVVCPEEGELPEALRSEDIPTYIVPFYGIYARNPLHYFKTISRIRAIARKHSAKIIHVNQQYFSNYGVIVGRACGLPVIVHLRGVESEDFFNQFGRWVIKADKVICISQAVQSSLLKYALEHFNKATASTLTKRLSIIYDGMRYQQKRIAPDILRKELGIPYGSKVIGIVGQVIPEKGVSEFVEAANLIHKENDRAHFLVVGEDPYHSRNFLNQIKTRVAKLGLAEHFTFTGFRKDAVDMFHVMDVSVLASWQEAFGRVILESMITGVPVVATNVGGVPEIIENGKSGILIPKKNAEAIANGVMTVLNMPENDRISMAVEGRRSMMRFSIDAHVEQIQAVYEELLAKRSRKHRKEERVE